MVDENKINDLESAIRNLIYTTFKSSIYISIIVSTIYYIFLKYLPYFILIGVISGCYCFYLTTFFLKKMFVINLINTLKFLSFFLIKVTIIITIGFAIWYYGYKIGEYVIGLALAQISIIYSSILHARYIIKRVNKDGKA